MIWANILSETIFEIFFCKLSQRISWNEMAGWTKSRNQAAHQLLHLYLLHIVACTKDHIVVKVTSQSRRKGTTAQMCLILDIFTLLHIRVYTYIHMYSESIRCRAAENIYSRVWTRVVQKSARAGMWGQRSQH